MFTDSTPSYTTIHVKHFTLAYEVVDVINLLVPRFMKKSISRHLGLRPRAEFSLRPWAQVFTLRTTQPANNRLLNIVNALTVYYYEQDPVVDDDYNFHYSLQGHPIEGIGHLKE